MTGRVCDIGAMVFHMFKLYMLHQYSKYSIKCMNANDLSRWHAVGSVLTDENCGGLMYCTYVTNMRVIVMPISMTNGCVPTNNNKTRPRDKGFLTLTPVIALHID